MAKTLSVIIPAYNEEDSLKVYLQTVLKHCEEKGYQLIITNDGSKDGTLKLLQQYADSPNLTIVNHKLNKGYGGAIKSGIKAARTDYVVTIDADGQHELSDVDHLLQIAEERDTDMIVGSRKGQKEASWYRGLGKSLIRGIAKILMPIDIHDLNSGMKLYDTELAKHYLHLCPNGMAYSDTITLVFISQRHLVIEEPISINQRIAGVSTINTRTAIETVKEILNIVVLFNPGRIFFPIAIAAMVLGTIYGLAVALIKGEGLSVTAMLMIVTGLIFFFLGLVAEQLSMIRKKGLD